MRKTDEHVLTLKELNENIDYFIKSNYDIINSINDLRKTVDLDEIELPNIAITINNKIKEIAIFFKKRGIEFYTEGNKQNFIGYTIIYNFYIKFLEALKILNYYPTAFAEELDIKADLLNEISSGFKNKILLSFKRIFNAKELEKQVELTSSDLESSNKLLTYYLNLNEMIYYYKLSDNLIETIKNFIETYFTSFLIYGIDVSVLFKNFIENDLKKLGLSDLIIPLYGELIETYENINSNLKETLPNFGFEKKLKL